ncbi:sugar phosphate isomerase/epimerase family protein [Methylobrevis albus]|uniref:Sugar phosphate isomerase/epimerase n=1 Tax=Methylobrevis albus TaxID=2793297 RepID=A0A931MXX2_9HYPH|nr:sugar phosphate isomerase/epimerase [Methylobrevis albus]MBH0236469.1 sugar phosphate isomerase/epimerase [Methylobrevis albus]
MSPLSPTAISLAHLTVLDLPPPAMVRLAAELGYDRVGLRLIRVTDTTPGYPLHDDPAALRATRDALDATGIAVNDIEFVRLTPEFRAEALLPFLDAGAVLGARHVICAPYDPDLGRLSDNLAALHAFARPRGLACVLEFFPWTNVPDLAAAVRVVEATGAADIGILVDTLHFDRSGSRLADLAALPAGRLPFLHLCDAPVRPPYTTEALLHAGRAERLPPGDGEIDLAAILTHLPRDVPLALEVPMAGLQARDGSARVAAHVLDRARRFLRSTGRL